MILKNINNGNKIFRFAKKIWPFNRSLTGKGTEETLLFLKKVCQELKIKKEYSRKKVYDWRVPDEWNVEDAYIITPEGKQICDFKKNNLHLVNYSIPVNCTLNFQQLSKKLHFIKEIPNAIPYRTSYYKKDWGFCISYNEFKKLKKGNYKIIINSKHTKGKLLYGEIILKGKSKKEIFFSTYICHPSLANNEISGPSLLIYLSKWIKNLHNRKYSYRIVFVPETIGSIIYLNKNLDKMKKNIIAGYNVSCVGDERSISFLPSKNENTLSDRVALQVLEDLSLKYKKYTWLDRGSDERQYCSVGVELPVASVMRSKYGEYKEYHTSLDRLGRVVTPKGFQTSYEIYKKIISKLEKNIYPIATNICEPNLGKRGLYETTGGKNNIYNKTNKKFNSRRILDILSYSDGKNSIFDIAQKCKLNFKEVKKILLFLNKKSLLKMLDLSK